MRPLILALLAIFFFVSPPALAASLPATTATAQAALAAAKGGDIIVLAAGTYDGSYPAQAFLKNRTFSPPLTIDARAPGVVLKQLTIGSVTGLKLLVGSATPGCVSVPCGFTALTLSGVTNAKVLGGDFQGPEVSVPGQVGVQADGYAVRFIDSKDVELSGAITTGFRAAVAVTRTDGFKITNNRCIRTRSDCFDAAASWNGLIEANTCEATRITDAAHADCIQLWSVADQRPTGNITIRLNKIMGPTDGILLSNHGVMRPAGFKPWNAEPLTVATKVDEGGFDNITIEGNQVWTTYINAIAAGQVRGLTVKDNNIVTLLGAQPRAALYVSPDSTILASCGNTVTPWGDYKGLKEAPCEAAPTPAQSTEIATLKVQLTAAQALAVQLAADLAAAKTAGSAQASQFQASLDDVTAKAADLLDRIAKIKAPAF